MYRYTKKNKIKIELNMKLKQFLCFYKLKKVLHYASTTVDKDLTSNMNHTDEFIESDRPLFLEISN